MQPKIISRRHDISSALHSFDQNLMHKALETRVLHGAVELLFDVVVLHGVRQFCKDVIQCGQISLNMVVLMSQCQ